MLIGDKMRTNIMRSVFFVTFSSVLFGFASSSVAESSLTTTQEPTVCDPVCGCDGLYVYDSVKEECMLNLQKLMKTVIIRYDNENTEDILSENGMARSIYIEGQKLFRGIMISVMFFMTCATICVLSACLYCCRINYSDRKLKHEVKAIAKKMNKSYMNKKETSKPKTRPPKSETCNVIVEEAGVFVV